MVKVVVLRPEEVTVRPDLVGTWLDSSHYHTLVEEDMDLYLPPSCAMEIAAEDNCDKAMSCNTCTKGLSEHNIVFKFRKNFFTEEEVASAYEGLKDAATETQNRGTAAGPRGEKQGQREWVTAYQWEVLETFKKGTTNILGEDPIVAIIEKYKDKKDEVSNRAQVWLSTVMAADNFNFDTWVDAVRKLDAITQTQEAKDVEDTYISKTTYANAVNSGIAGWYDRYPRIPYGRATSYTEQNPEKFAKAYPFLQSLSRGFKQLLPWRYGNQMRAAQSIDQRFVVPETPFTTVTVNKNFRTAAHYDPANMDDGFANLCVMSNNSKFSGAYLVFPEIGYACNIRPRDLLMVNNMAGLHGNTELILEDPTAERISMIAFFHEGMLSLGSWEYEQCRKEYVEWCKNNQEHPHWRQRFNGVWAGMWESKEWYDFLEAELGEEVLVKYHPEARANSLEGFF